VALSVDVMRGGWPPCRPPRAAPAVLRHPGGGDRGPAGRM